MDPRRLCVKCVSQCMGFVVQRFHQLLYQLLVHRAFYALHFLEVFQLINNLVAPITVGILGNKEHRENGRVISTVGVCRRVEFFVRVLFLFSVLWLLSASHWSGSVFCRCVVGDVRR